MENYTYQNKLIGKKQLRELLAWSFTNYDSMQACALADELKYLGFKYASQAGISISIEDLKIPFVKNLMLEKANQEIINAEKIYLKGKITEVERFQKIIDTWNLTSESLKEQVIYYFKNYDPLNSVYIMAFSGARGNLSQVRQLVGMRGLMSDPSGEIMNLPIKKNFREGLTITDYLMSGYGARKGIVDTALKTANSGYLTRRLIDVGQDILIREKDCLTMHSFLFRFVNENLKYESVIYKKILGHVLNRAIINSSTNEMIAPINTQITPKLILICKSNQIRKFYIRSPLTCNLYRAICQKCYGWDLANENLIDIGEAVGILSGQSIGEPGTQLTMRTFHTGGIFTSEARQQIISPINGIIRFYRFLKTMLLRTNRGEDVLITKNSGSIVLIPEQSTQDLIQIEILRNTILFPKNNQYIIKDTVIGELLNLNKQIKTEIKPIVSDRCGEIFMPRLKKKMNLLNNNKLLWILSGQLYNAPLNSFINFYSDYRINKYSYIFRTKIINHYKGYVKFINKKLNLSQKLIKTKNKKYSFSNSSLKKLTKTINRKNYLLTLQNLKYLFSIYQKNGQFYIQSTRNQQIGILITNKFRTLTGGTIYYDYYNLLDVQNNKTFINYIVRTGSIYRYNSLINYRTIVWLGEEIYKLNCEPNLLLVENGDFISEGFELIPGIFSKTSGIVTIQQKNNFIQTISIKSGTLYEGKQFKHISKKLYYPGETIFSSISIKKLSFCEHFRSKKIKQLLIRPIDIYEFSRGSNISNQMQLNYAQESNIQLQCNNIYSYKSKQTIKGTNNLNLISNTLLFKFLSTILKNRNIELTNNKKAKFVSIHINENLNLNKYISPNLQYKNLQSCFLIQPKQFIDQYTNLGYLEVITKCSLKIVKIKLKIKNNKQILLISNKDCLNIKKEKDNSSTLNDFIINSSNVNEIGRVIIDNDKYLTLQKGRLYFFPNCQNKNIVHQTNVQYKIISNERYKLYNNISKKYNVSLNYYDMAKLLINKPPILSECLTQKVKAKIEFSKFLIKQNGKYYSSLMPQFFKKFRINNSSINSKYTNIIRTNNLIKNTRGKLDRTLLVQNLEIIKNTYKNLQTSNYQLNLLKFIEYPFIKSTKIIGLYAITEDYFDQDINNVFCKNSEFIEENITLGLLNLEKEITGDIVQGLPRIEEILEARKKKLTIKRISISKKKGLLIQKTNLDPNFEFRPLGTPIKENEKINPHKLLKVYFNYYGFIKSFVCDQKKTILYARLIKNYESSYKSFKKVQIFILNSVQAVYQSQGVLINDKHLEVIIKQMTTKVLITYEGHTPLLRREVVDLYHIKYINAIIQKQNKQPAYYVPLLLGITKAALNNPSFISAASFQETTRVLTKAAIEGKIDWLRGLKENIIIGHLIPSGTGSQNYHNCFKISTLSSSTPL